MLIDKRGTFKTLLKFIPASLLHFSLHCYLQYQLSRISKICFYENRSCVGQNQCAVKQTWVKISAVAFDNQVCHLIPLSFSLLICKIGTLIIQGLWESEITNIAHIVQWVSSYKHSINICCRYYYCCHTHSHLRESEFTSQGSRGTESRVVKIWQMWPMLSYQWWNLSVHE